MEINSSGMRSRTHYRGGVLAILVPPVLLVLTCLVSEPMHSVSAEQSNQNRTGYVGSRACAKCHPSTYESFSRTDMGRSMSEITPPVIEQMSPAKVFDSKLNRRFE